MAIGLGDFFWPAHLGGAPRGSRNPSSPNYPTHSLRDDSGSLGKIAEASDDGRLVARSGTALSGPEGRLPSQPESLARPNAVVRPLGGNGFVLSVFE